MVHGGSQYEIEQALWDIVGQDLGVPVHRLFGGAIHRKLRLYANINRHVATDDERRITWNDEVFVSWSDTCGVVLQS